MVLSLMSHSLSYLHIPITARCSQILLFCICPLWANQVVYAKRAYVERYKTDSSNTENLTATVGHISTFWDIIPYNLLKADIHIGRIYLLYLQGGKVSEQHL
jgi:hypothetical protein